MSGGYIKKRKPSIIANSLTKLKSSKNDPNKNDSDKKHHDRKYSGKNQNISARLQSSYKSEQRIQKFLSHHGFASRRDVEHLITKGLIEINGMVAKLGDKCSMDDEIAINGEVLEISNLSSIRPRVLLYNKNMGEICSLNDKQGRNSVYDNLPLLDSGRWVSVGRLDINTSGLLLFTNDGELANRLMHPKYQISREYLVRIHGNLSDSDIDKLKKGVLLDNSIAKIDEIHPHVNNSFSTNKLYFVTLHEGKNREVRKLFQSLGLEVSRLKRIRYGNIKLISKIKQGGFMELSDIDVKRLYAQVGL